MDAAEFLRLQNTVANLSDFQGGQELLQQQETELQRSSRASEEAAREYQRVSARHIQLQHASCMYTTTRPRMHAAPINFDCLVSRHLQIRALRQKGQRQPKKKEVKVTAR